MSLLLVGPIPPEEGGTSSGGVARHVWGLATALAARGHDVALLADNLPAERPSPVRHSGLKLYGVEPAARALANPFAWQPATWRRSVAAGRHLGPGWPLAAVLPRLAAYRRVLAAERPRLVHVQHLGQRFAFAHFAGGGGPLVATVQSVTSFADGPGADPRAAALIGRSAALARNLFHVSEFVRQAFVARFRAPAGGRRSWVLPNPSDAARFRPIPRAEARARLGLPADRPVALFVGALIPLKGAGVLLEAVAKLGGAGSPVTAVLVGDGPERGRLEALGRDLGLGEVVRFEGLRAEADLADYYSAADVFVLPSAAEGFSLAFVEATLCGCPVLGCAESLDELLAGRDIGWRVPAGDPARLAEALGAAIARPWDHDAIRARGLDFSWERRIADFEAAYEAIAPSTTSPPC